MDVAAAGGLIIFFSLFVGLILVGLLVFSYAAYSFFVTLTNTAAGNDEIIWPGEPIQDWLFKVWYLGWLVALCAVPASLVLAALGLPKPLFTLCIAVLLWLTFPVVLLSSLSASSRLIVFRPVIVRMMLTHFGTTLAFYASSGLVVLFCVVVGYVALFRLPSAPVLDQPVLTIPLAAGIEAIGCLIYARLLGRTAWIISLTGSGKRKKRSPERDRVETFDPWSLPDEEPQQRRQSGQEFPQKRKSRPRKLSKGYDPWAIPAKQPVRKATKSPPSRADVPEDPLGPAQGSYELMGEGSPPAPEAEPTYSSGEGEAAEPYAVSASAGAVGRPLPTPVAPEDFKREEELAAPRRLPPLPSQPLLNGVYSFPFYAQTAGPCGTLALGFLGVLALLRLVLSLLPV